MHFQPPLLPTNGTWSLPCHLVAALHGIKDFLDGMQQLSSVCMPGSKGVHRMHEFGMSRVISCFDQCRQ